MPDIAECKISLERMANGGKLYIKATQKVQCTVKEPVKHFTVKERHLRIL